MIAEEYARRREILERMDDAVYCCAGALAAMVDRGVVTHPMAVEAVQRFREARADYDAVNAIDAAMNAEP